MKLETCQLVAVNVLHNCTYTHTTTLSSTGLDHI